MGKTDLKTKNFTIKQIKENIIGNQYSNLTVLSYFGHIKKDSYWSCRCKCGNDLIISKRCLIQEITRACKKCSANIRPTGKDHYAWQGYGDISKNLWNSYINSAKVRNLEFKITIEFAWDLFLKQNRKCALTGWELYFNSSYKNQKDKNASLDRIDSTKGYIEENVQWTHKDVNKLKKNFNNDYFLTISKAIGNYQNLKRNL